MSSSVWGRYAIIELGPLVTGLLLLNVLLVAFRVQKLVQSGGIGELDSEDEGLVGFLIDRLGGILQLGIYFLYGTGNRGIDG